LSLLSSVSVSLTQVKIIDFGVAMQCEVDAKEVLAGVTGTRHYMAPEILTSGMRPVAMLKVFLHTKPQ
jgi:serine/threonine protein kinase